MLVACCFLLPFVTVSCGNDQGQLTASFTGRDLVAGGTAELGSTIDPEALRTATDLNGGHDADPHVDELGSAYTKPIDVQPFLLIALVLVGLGGLAGAWPWPWSRALLGSGIAATATVFLIGGEWLARGAASARVAADFAPLTGAPNGAASTAVTSSVGFWAALGLLLVLTGGHLVQLLRHSRRPVADPAEPGGPPEPVPEPVP